MTSSPRTHRRRLCCVAGLRRAASRAAQRFLAARSAARSRRIIREYLITHPEVLQEAMAELEKRQAAARSREA